MLLEYLTSRKRGSSASPPACSRYRRQSTVQPCPPESHYPDPPQRSSHLQNMTFSQLFLCLSRACLGKMIVLGTKGRRKGVFRTGLQREHAAVLEHHCTIRSNQIRSGQVTTLVSVPRVHVSATCSVVFVSVHHLLCGLS
jgi:hypothetical protein